MPKDVVIDVNVAGMGSFVVGGVDISEHVTSVTVRCDPGRPNRVEFEVVGDVYLDVKDAEVEMVRKA